MTSLQRAIYLALCFGALWLISLSIGLLSISQRARAHEHGGMVYDWECCSGMDCAPVLRSEWSKPELQASILGYSASRVPVLYVTTIAGTAPITSATSVRQSKDARMHACLRGGLVVCVYMPPTN